MTVAPVYDLGADFAEAVERCIAAGRLDLFARLLEEMSAALRAAPAQRANALAQPPERRT